MKLAFVLARMCGGGAERVVSELANFFAENGHEVSIIVTVESECVYFLRDDVKYIDLTKFNRGFISRVAAIRRCVNEYNFDATISFLYGSNIETILATLGKKAPTIISERNNPYVDPRARIYRFLRALTYPFADGYVFQTPDARDFFGKKIRKKSVVIMNPIKPNLPIAYEGEREKRAVNVGRLFKQKNQKVFIDAFCEFRRNHSDYIAEIYGEGPLEKELADYIRTKGAQDYIKLCGFSAEILQKIRKAALFVMSSDYEGMSNALIEAVGMGTPCVSTDHPIGGARMTISDGENGFLVPVGDSKTMAEKMAEIVDNPEISQRFSSNGQLLRERLSIKIIAEQWLEYVKNKIEAR